MAIEAMFGNGDDVNTDVIFRKIHYTAPTAEIWRTRSNLDRTSQTGQAGRYCCATGCGSSREQAASCKEGVGAVIASFARIFFRNAINEGLSCAPEASDDVVEVVSKTVRCSPMALSTDSRTP
jgi:hypothetical protein